VMDGHHRMRLIYMCAHGWEWRWKIEGTGEEGCRMVRGGGEVCGMRGAGRDVIRGCKSVGRAGTGPGGERGTWQPRRLQSIVIV